MIELIVIPDIDGHWADLNDITPPAMFGYVDQIARISKGMTSGRSSVAVRGTTKDGQVVVLEMSLGQLDIAVRTFKLMDESET